MKKISHAEKMFLSHIISLSQTTGYCYATNRYFREFSNYSDSSVHRIIRRLVALSLIRVCEENGRRKIVPTGGVNLTGGVPSLDSGGVTMLAGVGVNLTSGGVSDPAPIENKEERTKTVSTPAVAPTRNTVSVPKPLYNFVDHVWNNIPDSKVEEWHLAFPACDIELELRRMAVWLEANPTKRKSNYARFIANWLTKTQDKGGDKAWPKWKK